MGVFFSHPPTYRTVSRNGPVYKISCSQCQHRASMQCFEGSVKHCTSDSERNYPLTWAYIRCMFATHIIRFYSDKWRSKTRFQPVAIRRSEFPKPITSWVVHLIATFSRCSRREHLGRPLI